MLFIQKLHLLIKNLPLIQTFILIKIEIKTQTI